MDLYLSWFATAATIAAATLTASNLGSRITGYGFVIFTVGSISWLAYGALAGEAALVWTNAVLTFLNLFGVWRWLGRQVKVEEGSRAASLASETSSGETLFPVSLLGRAPVRSGEAALGNCVDAMAGCTSGRIAYLVVSEGGIAGAGETLRRIPWNALEVEGEEVVAKLSAGQFCALEPIAREQWPQR